MLEHFFSLKKKLPHFNSLVLIMYKYIFILCHPFIFSVFFKIFLQMLRFYWFIENQFTLMYKKTVI